MTGRIYNRPRRVSLDAVRRAALALDYVSRRQLFSELARAIIELPPILDRRPASREDVAALLFADIAAILHERSYTGNAGAMCAADPDAAREPRPVAAEPRQHGPHRRREHP